MSWSITISGHKETVDVGALEAAVVHEFRQILPHLVQKLPEHGLSSILFSGNAGSVVLHGPEAPAPAEAPVAPTPEPAAEERGPQATTEDVIAMMPAPASGPDGGAAPVEPLPNPPR